MKLDGVHIHGGPPGIGHAHFWERAMSRRRLIQTAGAAGLALAGTRLLPPRAAWAESGAGGAEPRPIPGGFATIDDRRWHVYTPGPSNPLDPNSVPREPSTITDFDGLVAICDVQGTGMEQGLGPSGLFPFSADLRVMSGRYRGLDGAVHEGTFAFV